MSAWRLIRSRSSIVPGPPSPGETVAAVPTMALAMLSDKSRLREVPAQTRFAGSNDRFGATFHLELAEDAGHVVAHGLRAQKQPVSDGVIGITLSDQPEDIVLS